jgi:hypothetical protein
MIARVLMRDMLNFAIFFFHEGKLYLTLSEDNRTSNIDKMKKLSRENINIVFMMNTLVIN